jgi:hypothetical protein
MMWCMEALELALGLLLLLLVFWDVFETIIVPRPTPGRLRLSRHLIRGAWRVARANTGAEMGATRDRLLGLFAPAATVLLLVAWLTGLVLGYGLIFFALRGGAPEVALRATPPLRMSRRGSCRVAPIGRTPSHAPGRLAQHAPRDHRASRSC